MDQRRRTLFVGSPAAMGDASTAENTFFRVFTEDATGSGSVGGATASPRSPGRLHPGDDSTGTERDNLVRVLASPSSAHLHSPPPPSWERDRVGSLLVSLFGLRSPVQQRKDKEQGRGRKRNRRRARNGAVGRGSGREDGMYDSGWRQSPGGRGYLFSDASSDGGFERGRDDGEQLGRSLEHDEGDEADERLSGNVMGPIWVPNRHAIACSSCTVSFSFLNRRHHCRRCGNIFCQKCSSKRIALPQFGFEKLVRVCDGCYDLQTRDHRRGELDGRRPQQPSNF